MTDDQIAQLRAKAEKHAKSPRLAFRERGEQTLLLLAEIDYWKKLEEHVRLEQPSCTACDGKGETPAGLCQACDATGNAVAQLVKERDTLSAACDAYTRSIREKDAEIERFRGPSRRLTPEFSSYSLGWN